MDAAIKSLLTQPTIFQCFNTLPAVPQWNSVFELY